MEEEKKLENWKDSYKGKLWSTAVQTCFKAPFVEVAIQHLLKRIDEKHQKEIDLAVSKERDTVVKKILSLPAKFWEDSDHYVGGYISKKDLMELLQNLINTK